MVLIRQQIARLLEPSLDCAHEVYEELRKIVLSILIPEIQRYYRLQSRLCDVMEEVLDQCLSPTTAMITSIVELENAHININHPDFVGGGDSLLNLFQMDNEESNQHSLLGGEGNVKPSIYDTDPSRTSTHSHTASQIEDKQEEDRGSSWGFASFMGKKTPKEKEGVPKRDEGDYLETQSISVLRQSEVGNERMVKSHVKRVRAE